MKIQKLSLFVILIGAVSAMAQDGTTAAKHDVPALKSNPAPMATIPVPVACTKQCANFSIGSDNIFDNADNLKAAQDALKKLNLYNMTLGGDLSVFITKYLIADTAYNEAWGTYFVIMNALQQDSRKLFKEFENCLSCAKDLMKVSAPKKVKADFESTDLEISS